MRRRGACWPRNMAMRPGSWPSSNPSICRWCSGMPMPDQPLASHRRAYAPISSSMRWYRTGSLPAMPRSSSARRPIVTYMKAWKSMRLGVSSFPGYHAPNPSRTPGRGAGSGELDLGAHGHRPVGRDRPYRGVPFVGDRAAAQLERSGVEERRARLGRVVHDPASGRVVAGEVEQQRRRQWSVDDQPGIALGVHGPATIVVDTVAVEGERREAEQQHGIGGDPPAPGHVGGRGFAPGRLVPLTRLHLFAKDRPALLLEGQPLATEEAVDHGGENQRAGAARLDRHVGQLGLPPERLTDADGAMETEAVAREH